jgi:drug/metabolite transporter, DME family
MSAVLLGELAALGAAVCWAVAPILYRRALFSASPMSANIVRCATNAAVMLVLLFGLGWAGAFARLPLEVVLLTVVSGLIGLGLGDTLYLYALKSVGVSRAVPLAATYPLFSLLWFTALLGQPLAWTAAVGAVVILLGIWLLSRERGDSTVHFTGKIALTGVVLSLLTAVVWSVSISMMDVVVSMPGVSTLDANYAVVTMRIAAMAVFLLMLSPLLDKGKGFLKLKRRTVIELCVGGLIANALGWLLMNYSFLNILEAQAVPISSTTSLFSAFAGFALFHEKFSLSNVLGAAVVVAGVMLIFIV